MLEVYHESIQREIANLILERRPADDQRFFTSYFAVYDRFAHFTPNIEELITNFASEPFFVLFILKCHIQQYCYLAPGVTNVDSVAEIGKRLISCDHLF